MVSQQQKWWFSGIALFACSILFTAASGLATYGNTLVWPTPNPAFLNGEHPEHYLQPTSSGRLASADWGCTRNGGSRFHEGVDLKSVQRSPDGRSLDAIGSIAAGVVAHVSRTTQHSNYGKYVVISHVGQGLEWVSLYAHLEQIADSIRPGVRVRAGDVLGTMGNSSSNIPIPVANAHLHLEIGVRLNSKFDSWYALQGFETRNWHGSWNGMNLLGLHPLEFFNYYLDHPGAPFFAYFLTEPVSFECWIHFEKRPDFLERNPVFLRGQPAPAGPSWYRVGFTWYGMPVEWIPAEASTLDRRLDPDAVHVHQLRHEKPCRNWVDESPAGLVPTSLLLRHIQLLKTH